MLFISGSKVQKMIFSIGQLEVIKKTAWNHTARRFWVVNQALL
jgi:hypothetical protein